MHSLTNLSQSAALAIALVTGLALFALGFYTAILCGRATFMRARALRVLKYRADESRQRLHLASLQIRSAIMQIAQPNVAPIIEFRPVRFTNIDEARQIAAQMIKAEKLS